MTEITPFYPTGLNALTENTSSTYPLILNATGTVNTTSTTTSGSSPTFIALRTCFIFIVVILTISGNIFSISVTRQLTTLAESTQVLMIALALCDLSIGCHYLIYCISSAFDNFVFGSLGCTVLTTITNSLFGASILTIMLINIERYIAVTRPFKFPVWCTKRRCIILVTVSYFLLFCGSVVGTFVFQSQIQYYEVMAICFFRKDSHLVFLYMLLASDLFPVITMSCVYIRIIKISRRHEIQANRNDNNGPNNNSDNKALKSFLVVTLTFGICYTPLFLGGTVEAYTGFRFPESFFFFIAWLPACNCIFNVYIYCIFNKSFRQLAKKLILQRFTCFRNFVAPHDIDF